MPSLSQTEIVNGGFEDWTPDASGLFEEPGANWWGTLNKIRLLGPSAPITTTKSTDAHSGSYSALLENKLFGTIKISAILTTGYFDSKATPPDNFKLGRPFSGRPSKMTGWYKFKPVNGDSCGAGIYLTRWNSGTNNRDTIARANTIFHDKGIMDSFEKFELELNYFSGLNPDTINVSFIASAGTVGFGTTGNAQIGTQMWVDDVTLQYADGIELPLMAETKFSVHGSGESAELILNDETICKNSEIIIYNINGCEINRFQYSSERNELPLNIKSSGTYFFVINSNGKTISGGLFQL
jgi:hypothetical protein